MNSLWIKLRYAVAWLQELQQERSSGLFRGSLRSSFFSQDWQVSRARTAYVFLGAKAAKPRCSLVSGLSRQQWSNWLAELARYEDGFHD